MNQNDTERYFWRTGHPLSADHRLFRKETAGPKVTNRTIILLVSGFSITTAILFLLR